MNDEAIRREDEVRYEQYRATLTPSARAELDAAAALIGRRGRSLTVADGGRVVVGVTWDAHTVRHRVGATDPARWFEALLLLERQGEVSVSCYAAPADETQWQAWQDLPLSEWGTRDITSVGVLTLATHYGREPGPAIPPWFCDECTCLCGRQSARPLGGFCALCALEAAP